LSAISEIRGPDDALQILWQLEAVCTGNVSNSHPDGRYNAHTIHACTFPLITVGPPTYHSHFSHHFPTLQAPRQTIVASLGSKNNGIASATRLAVAQRQQTVAAPSALEVMCADGRKGGKLKTNKSAKKRYKITGSGKVMVRRAGKQHLNEKMNRAKNRQLSKPQQVDDSKLDLIKGCLPYAKIK
jgi:large subunit ribosomal protein L35